MSALRILDNSDVEMVPAYMAPLEQIIAQDCATGTKRR
ncbi:hypothetical protein PybrP1_008923 [[Pythium] brassicae (nom. inval.)]|nr:hypothetical protein PybrP1_008923 [[Pythium] brassicae (nom. inval.)]